MEENDQTRTVNSGKRHGREESAKVDAGRQEEVSAIRNYSGSFRRLWFT